MQNTIQPAEIHLSFEHNRTSAGDVFSATVSGLGQLLEQLASFVDIHDKNMLSEAELAELEQKQPHLREQANILQADYEKASGQAALILRRLYTEPEKALGEIELQKHNPNQIYRILVSTPGALALAGNAVRPVNILARRKIAKEFTAILPDYLPKALAYLPVRTEEQEIGRKLLGHYIALETRQKIVSIAHGLKKLLHPTQGDSRHPAYALTGHELLHPRVRRTIRRVVLDSLLQPKNLSSRDYCDLLEGLIPIYDLEVELIPAKRVSVVTLKLRLVDYIHGRSSVRQQIESQVEELPGKCFFGQPVLSREEAAKQEVRN